MIEDYDPNENVCVDQDSYNKAYAKAVESKFKKDMKDSRVGLFIYMIIWLIFLIWAIMLAMKNTQHGPERTSHLFFAIIAPPVYVLSTYLGKQ